MNFWVINIVWIIIGYLHYKSSHPKSQKESIPHSQFLRMKRNCTTKEDSRSNITKLTKEFKSRGYPTTTLEVSQSAVANITQNCLLNHTPKPRKSSGKLIYVTTYHPNGPNIRKILIDNTKVLSRHPHTAHIKDDSFLMAFKRPPNLRDTLVHSRFSQNDIPPAPGTWKCNKKKCHSCPHILEQPNFTNTDGSVTHSTMNHITCTTSHVIYLITCHRCHKKYVGQTSKNLNIRMYQHLYNIKNFHETPVAKHFNSQNHRHRHFLVQAICQAPRNNTARLSLEKAWIKIISTYQPWGMNIKT